jgi:hypothetical protein
MSKTKFSGKRPVLFYQHAFGEGAHLQLTRGPRIRIFYPDGKVEWATCQDYFLAGLTFRIRPCWLNRRDTPKNMKKALALAREFDSEEGFGEMEFICEL